MKINNDKYFEEIKGSITSVLSQVNLLFQIIDADEKDVSLINDARQQLDELFLIVVAGEYNAGKSAFINALIGNDFLKTGITPTTDAITILYYSEEAVDKTIKKGLHTIGINAEILLNTRIVDTPGTNAILRDHEVLTSEFIPRSDIVIFVTSVDRPFTESERAFLEKIKEWRKKIIFVINKIDLIDDDNDLEKVRDYVADNAYKLLETHPTIFFLSAKQSLKDELEGNRSIEINELEKYILETISQRERMRIKLTSPIDIIENISSKYEKSNTKRIAQIKEDRQLINDIEKQLNLFHEDFLRRFKFRYADIDNAILEFQKRGIAFFDDTFRISRLLDLANKERIQREYKDKVITNLSQLIDEKVHNLIEWLVDENYNQWQIVNGKISERVHDLQSRIVTEHRQDSIQMERKNIINDVKRESQRVIERFDRNLEAQQIANDAQLSVAASAAVEVGAIGLGTIVTILATSASADLTGILLAGITAALGFFIIPTKRSQAKNAFNKKVDSLRNQLFVSLSDEILRQLEIVIDNIRSTIEPYQRFVKSEEDSFSAVKEKIEGIELQVEQIRSKILKI